MMHSVATNLRSAERERAATNHSTVSLLLAINDAMLLAILFVGPLFMGGRHPWGRLVYVTLISGVAVTWSMAQVLLPANQRRWQNTPGLLLGLAAVILVGVQLMPLSTEALHYLSPGMEAKLPGWNGIAENSLGLGKWLTVSLAPEETRRGLSLTLSYFLLYCVLSQRLQRLSDASKMLNWIALATVWLAVLALLQLAFSNGKFLWFYDHPSRETMEFAKGPFQNQNHLGQMMALGIGSLVWVLVSNLQATRNTTKHHRGHRHLHRHPVATSDGSRLPRWLLPAAGIGISGIAVALTLSRGAWLAYGLALGVACLGLAVSRVLPKSLVITITAGGAFALALGAYSQSDRFISKLDASMQAESLADLSQWRSKLWNADFRAHRDFPWLGTGVGSHRYVYRGYLQEDHTQEFAHAESSYVHLLLETGRAGILLLILAFSLVGYAAYQVTSQRSNTKTLILVAVISGIVASAGHAIADFVWQIPACFILLLFLLSILLRLPEMNRDEAEPSSSRRVSDVPLATSLVTFALMAVSSIWMVRTCLPAARAAIPWDSYRRVAEGDDSENLNSNDVAVLQRKVKLLRSAVLSDPADARLHERMASCLFQKLEQTHGVLHADCLISQAFSDRASRKTWLQEKYKADAKLFALAAWHAKMAASLSPMLGRMYLIRGTLQGIESGTSPWTSGAFKQAEAVRPFDATILLSQGLGSILLGDLPAGLQYWQRALKCDPLGRYHVVPVVAKVLTADVILESLSPTPSEAARFYYAFRDQANNEAMNLLAAHCGEAYGKAAAVEKVPTTATSLFVTSGMFWQLVNENDRALQAYRAAVQKDPFNYEARVSLATVAINLGRADLAYDHARWCLRRKPDDPRPVEIANRCIGQISR